MKRILIIGAGLSSIYLIKYLEEQAQKYGWKVVVADMDVDEENAAIVRATIDLAHSLGLTVTAEGVESRLVHDQLLGMGCDYFQGYFVSKPMVRSDVSDWLSGSFKYLSAEDMQ